MKPLGKVEVVKRLNISPERIVIGDGSTDLEIKEQGMAEKFYLYTENVKRETLVNKADYVINDFKELIDIEYNGIID